MKTPFYLICLCFLILSCKKDQKEVETQPDEYLIEGSAKGLVNGLRAYLKGTDEKGFLKDTDTAIIMNERFVFQGKVDSIRAWHLEINSLDSSFPFVIENAQFKIDVNAENIKESRISGTTMNDAIDQYNTTVFALQDSITSISDLYRKRLVEKSDVRGMSDNIKALKDELEDLPFKFMKEHQDNPYGLVLLNYMIRRNTGDKGKIVNAYDEMPEHLVNSNLGRRISKNIPNIRRQYEIIAATEIGKVAPNFSAPTPTGKMLSLEDVKGKATLIHFWSSWYKASRRDNRRLVEVYNTFHDKGLEMIGVSLDGNNKQTNPKKDWKNAIKEDQLIWPQISNLNYFNDTISKAYSIRVLPASFLLDSNGVIVGKNLNGNSLSDKLNELLGE